VKLKFKIVLLCFTLILLQNSLHEGIYCQTSKELDKKKQDNIQQLNYSRNLLDVTSKTKSSSLNQLNLIQRNIELRAEIIGNISDELTFLKNDIEGNNQEIVSIESKIKKIKEDYSKLVIVASRNLDKEYAMMYIFSSQDFNQAYQRIKYLRYIARYRTDLVNQLLKEEANLKVKNSQLITSRRNTEKLLTDRKRELVSLDNDKKKSISLVRSLQNKEAELKKEIIARERIQAEIDREIRKVIEEEAARSKAANRGNIMTPADKIISTEFFKNKGRLPWPSEQGIVTRKFGEQNHPVLKGIKIKSDGLDINTVEGERVRCVFDGEVTKVIPILGANYSVIIKHGEYYTLYQNLVNVQVKVGDKIKTKAVIGTAFTDEDNNTKFHFQLWKDKFTQNPELWLSK